MIKRSYFKKNRNIINFLKQLILLSSSGEKLIGKILNGGALSTQLKTNFNSVKSQILMHAF
jgi:hypothetical protein